MIGNYYILENIVCYMTEIDEDDFLDINMRYCYNQDECREELENIKISKEYYNARKLAFLSGLNVDPLALVYALTQIDPDKPYSDSEFIEAFCNAKEAFCSVDHLFGGNDGRS